MLKNTLKIPEQAYQVLRIFRFMPVLQVLIWHNYDETAARCVCHVSYPNKMEFRTPILYARLKFVYMIIRVFSGCLACSNGGDWHPWDFAPLHYLWS